MATNKKMVLNVFRSWIKNNEKKIRLRGQVEVRPLDPLSALAFVINKLQVAKASKDTDYTNLRKAMSGKKIHEEWIDATESGLITLDVRGNRYDDTVVRWMIKIGTMLPPPNQRRLTLLRKYSPRLRIKKKIICLYRST